MKNLFNKYLKYSHVWESIYSGKGYVQGMGMDIKLRRLRIGTWLSVITEWKIDVDMEWMKNLRSRIQRDIEQEQRTA